MAGMEVHRRVRRQGSSFLLHVPSDRLADEVPEFDFCHIRTAVCYQLSAISCQLSAIGCQPSVSLMSTRSMIPTIAASTGAHLLPRASPAARPSSTINTFS
jgi:hypothetical protein